jgi:hypothetical protein
MGPGIGKRVNCQNDEERDFSVMRVLKDQAIEIEEIKQVLKDLAEYYSHPISERQLEMYAHDLISVGADKLKEISREYRTWYGHKKFPMPSTLLFKAQFPDVGSIFKKKDTQ